MKKIYFLAISAMVAMSAAAQSSITVERTDGTKISTSLDNFVKVTFDNAAQTEIAPTSDIELHFTTATASLPMTYLGHNMWLAETTLQTGDTFRFSLSSDGAAGWGAATEGSNASTIGVATASSTTPFTVTDEIAGQQTIVFNDLNGVYSFMTPPQQQKDIRILTFEDKDYKGTGNVFGTSPWTGLIDTPQYGGELLYGESSSMYMWYDENNTELYWEGLDGAYYNGGYAISNYFNTPTNSFNYQLSIPFNDNGNTFCMACNYEGMWSGGAKPIAFADGNAHIIRSIDITNSSYTAASLMYGDSYASAAKEGTQFIAHIRGLKEDGTTAEVTQLLCKDTDIITDKWITVDCTPLGKVTQIEIFVSGSSDLVGDYGLNTPGYVAFDNIVVEF